MVRKLTLDEWFLSYQLKKMAKTHFHVPGSIDINITPLTQHYVSSGTKPPYTAILIKAVALAAKKRPQLNRMYFRTFWGARLVEFDNCVVNVPVIMEDGGKTYLSAITLNDPHLMPISQIAKQLKEARTRKLADTKVTKFVVGSNNIFKRTILRVIHFLVFNFPHLYVERGGGGLSVSSLQNLDEEHFDMRFFPYGPTAMTFGLITIKTDQGNTTMKLGAGYDHMACRADEMTLGLKELSRILSQPDSSLLSLDQ